MTNKRCLTLLLVGCLLALVACRTPAGQDVAQAGTPTPRATATAAGPFCPEVPRPALLTVDAGGYAISHPPGGANCRPDLPQGVGEGLTIVGDEAFFAAVNGDDIAVHRLNARGEGAALDFTRQPAAGLLYQFAVSADGARLAWSAASVDADGTRDAGDITSTLWLADLQTTETRVLLGPQPYPDAALVPIRFTAGGRQLLYTVQPFVEDADWNSFGGRYQNLYSIAVDGDEATGRLLFDCESVGAEVCIGGVTMTGDEVTALAYVDGAGVLMVADGNGNTIPFAGGAPYTGFATFYEDGSLAFLAADPAVPQPDWVALFLVRPPYRDRPLLLAESAQLRTLLAFYDANSVVAAYANTPEHWTLALAAVDRPLALMQRDPDVRLLGVLPDLQDE